LFSSSNGGDAAVPISILGEVWVKLLLSDLAYLTHLVRFSSVNRQISLLKAKPEGTFKPLV
jgi:hypothetical protein